MAALAVNGNLSAKDLAAKLRLKPADVQRWADAYGKTIVPHRMSPALVGAEIKQLAAVLKTEAGRTRAGRTKAGKAKMRLSKGTHMSLPPADVIVIDCTEFMDDEAEQAMATTAALFQKQDSD